MADNKIINRIPMREASTKEEKLLLGFLHQEMERIDFGTIVLEITIRGRRIHRAKSNEISRSFAVGQD